MEQGATGINSSVPTASLTGRIQFVCCRYEPLLTDLLRCICFESVQPPLVSPAFERAFASFVVRRTDGYEPRAPGALYCDFYRLRFVRLLAWLAARVGGAVPRATLRSPEPHSPSEVPCTAHAFAASEGVANPRIRACTKHLACHDLAAIVAEARGTQNALRLNNFGTRFLSSSRARRIGVTTVCNPDQGDSHSRQRSKIPQFTRLKRVSPRG